ncbi:hypothetical protein [Thiothrix lacustris]|nr:hypothetical protein [Thiothrix lacustris]WMP17496.1 hypothetical protein RCS87_00135 [Thiothrix lacustris]
MAGQVFEYQLGIIEGDRMLWVYSAKQLKNVAADDFQTIDVQ